MIYFGTKSNYNLGTEIKAGGEGTIYTVEGNSALVAKIYHANVLSTELHDKLYHMMINPPDASVLSQIAWPIDIIYDHYKNFAGFVMSKLNVDMDLKAAYKYSPDKPDKLSGYQRLIIAVNICVVIDAVHKAGYVFGDFNPLNIGINSKTGKVAFFDADTYHFYDKSSGRTFRCCVGTDGYIAPELLAKGNGLEYKDIPLPSFTEETDNFALAIHIFRLLMNGYTPFNGIKEAENASTASPGVGNKPIELDYYCYKPGYKPQSAYVPDFNSFPPYMRGMFNKAFIDGRVNPRNRPTAAEWYKALCAFSKELVQCGDNPNHYFHKASKFCPYCEADERYSRNIHGIGTSSQMSFNTPVNIPVRKAATSTTSAPVVSSTSVRGTNTSPYVGGKPFNPTTQTKKRKKSGCLPIIIGIISVIIAVSAISSLFDSDDDDEYEVVETENPYVVDCDLLSLEPVKADAMIKANFYDTGKTNTEEPYRGELYCIYPMSTITYNLNGAYDRFTALWTLTNMTKDSKGKAYVEIYTDGQLIYTSPEVSAGVLPVPIDLNINSCNLLTIFFKGYAGDAILTNARLSNYGDKLKPTEYYYPGTLPEWLTNFSPLRCDDNAYVIQECSTIRAITGEPISHLIGSTTSVSEQTIEYYIKGEYKRLTGTWAVDDYFSSRIDHYYSFSVYADGELVYTSPSITGGDLPVQFDIDIKNCDKLALVFDRGASDYGSPVVVAGNLRLYP